MTDPGVEQLRRIARGLKDAGVEGKGLRRNLTKQINEAAKPLVKKISDPEHLKPYLPDRYALVLAADLAVAERSLVLGSNPRLRITAKGREHRRKVVHLDAGLINHPVFARGPRRRSATDPGWTWKNNQTGGMKPGFFSDACKDATPQIRAKVLTALTDTEREITGRG